MSTIRVLLADDHKIIRDGLKTLIEKEAGMEVIAEAEDGRKTVRLTQKLHPNVVIMDVTMSDMNGIARPAGRGRLVEVDWDTALDLVARKFKQIRERGEGKIGVLASGRLLNEESYLLGKLSRQGLRTIHIDLASNLSILTGPRDCLLPLGCRP